MSNWQDWVQNEQVENLLFQKYWEFLDVNSRMPSHSGGCADGELLPLPGGHSKPDRVGWMGTASCRLRAGLEHLLASWLPVDALSPSKSPEDLKEALSSAKRPPPGTLQTLWLQLAAENSPWGAPENGSLWLRLALNQWETRRALQAGSPCHDTPRDDHRCGHSE